MSCLWTGLSLLFVANFLQESASLTAEVSIECNQTVDVVAGESVTLNCTIMMKEGCAGDSYNLKNTLGEIPCDNSGLTEYTCHWDNQTYVSLTIRNVMKDENYTIVIMTDCGLAESHIKLQVKQDSKSIQDEPVTTPNAEQTTNYGTVPILTILIFIALFGILYFLFGTKRGRGITRCFKKTTQVPLDEA